MSNGKQLETVVSLAGNVDPTLGSAIQTATKFLDGINVKALVAGAGIAAAFGGATIATVNFAKDSVKAAIDFESNMADVAKVVDGLKDDAGNVTQAYAEMSDQILDLSTQIPMSAEEISQIVAAAGQSDIEADQLLGFAESAAKMGIAFDNTAEQAGQWMAQWRTSLNLTQEEVEVLADQINYLGNTSSEDANKLSEVVSELGSLGQIAGLSASDIAALGAATTGIDAAVAATGIKGVVTALSDAEAKSDVFEQLGIDASTFGQRMQDDAQTAVMDVLTAIKQLPEAQQAATINELFGKQSLATVGTLVNNLGNLEEQFNKVGDATQYAGSMQGEYDARAATTENSMELITNQIEAIKIKVGNELLPVLSEALSSIGPVISEITPVVVGVFSGLAESLQPIIPLVTEQLVPAIGQFVPIIFELGSTVLSTLVPPMAQIASAIMPALISVVNALMPVLQAVLAILSPLLDIFVAIITPIVELISEALAPLIEIVGSLIGTALQPLMPILQMVGTYISTYIGGVVQAVSPAIQSLQQIFQGITDFLSNVFVGNWSGAWNAVTSIFSGFASGIGSIIKAPVNVIISSINGLIGSINSLKVPDWVPGLGGMSPNIPSIPQLAAGGFTNGVSIAGEAGMEAVLSFDPAHRQENLSYWARAGQLLGVASEDILSRFATGSTNTNSINMGGITFAPVITVSGDADEKSVVKALRGELYEFADFLYEEFGIRLGGQHYAASW